MIKLPWIVRALMAAGFDSGWSISGESGEDIVNWTNDAPIPTIEELEEILPRD